MSETPENDTIFALLPISFLSALVNWAVLYAILKLKSFNHSFGFLSANQAIVDALHGSMFLFYFCPMVILDIQSFKTNSHHGGFLILLSYEVSVMTHLAISMNRLCAVWAPHRYPNIFSERNTKIIIAFIWFYTSTVAVLFYEVSCTFYFDEKIQFLSFSNSKLCGFIGWYGDLLKNSTIVAIVMVLDMLTVVKVRKMSRKISANISDQAQSRLSQREMRFLKQTVTQGTVFMLELLSYFFIPRYFANKWILFFATSFAWVAVHALDGLLVLLFNPEIRRFYKCKSMKHTTSSTSQT